MIFARWECCRRSTRIISGNSIPTPKSITGKAEAEERSMTVWIYVDTSKDVNDPEHLKVFADEAAADRWFVDNDPEGVAFKYDVLGS